MAIRLEPLRARRAAASPRSWLALVARRDRRARRSQANGTPASQLRGGLSAVDRRGAAAATAPATVTLPANTTVVPRTGGRAAPRANAPAQVNLVALLTVDGQRIDQGLVWRIYAVDAPARRAQTKLLMTKREPSPTVNLKPGDYIVNAAFGRADITRKITVAPGAATSEKFVLNAGGLRVKVLVDGVEPPPNTVSLRHLLGRARSVRQPHRVLGGAKPERHHSPQRRHLPHRLDLRRCQRQGRGRRHRRGRQAHGGDRLALGRPRHLQARHPRRRRGAARHAVDRADARRARSSSRASARCRRTSSRPAPIRSSPSRARAPSSATSRSPTARWRRSRC